MRKWIWVLTAALLLSGCGRAPVMETVTDTLEEQPLPKARAIGVVLPGEAALPAMEGERRRIYLCQDYEICIQTLDGGDLNATVETMSGFAPEELTLVSTQSGGIARHEFVWAAAGEGGDLLGRGLILDDGAYHYTMSVLRDAQASGPSAVVWDGVFASFRLV